MVRNPPTMQETRESQPTPVFLPEESPWTEEPGGLQSMGIKKSQKGLSN